MTKCMQPHHVAGGAPWVGSHNSKGGSVYITSGFIH